MRRYFAFIMILCMIAAILPVDTMLVYAKSDAKECLLKEENTRETVNQTALEIESPSVI